MGKVMYTPKCCVCWDSGHIGFIDPEGWLAGEIGDCWGLQWLIGKVCPQCEGRPSAYFLSSSKPPPPPAPPRRELSNVYVTQVDRYMFRGGKCRVELVAYGPDSQDLEKIACEMMKHGKTGSLRINYASPH